MPHKPEAYRDISEGPESASTGDIDVDCLITGAGPAGLTTAVCLSRFHRRVVVVDGGHSRASDSPFAQLPRLLRHAYRVTILTSNRCSHYDHT